MSAADCEQQGTGWGILEDLPGDPMIWVLIFSELVAFGLFLGAFAVARAVELITVFERDEPGVQITIQTDKRAALCSV